MLELEFYNTIDESIVPILLVITGIYISILVEDRYPEPVVCVKIRLVSAVHLLLNDQSFQRPVFDLHGVIIIIDVMLVIDMCHVRGKGDKVVETDLTVILGCFLLLNMISHILIVEIELVLIAV